MRLDKWFISNLDDSQRQIVVRDPNESIIVQGAAGSGKTNLAIHRAMQASAFGSYAIVIYTIALKRMIAYGLDVLGLDKDRIAYEWQFIHRGFDVDGHVYCKILKEKNEDGTDKITVHDRDTLYLVTEDCVKQYRRVEYRDDRKLELRSIDFGDWEEDRFYYAFGRRTSWFEEVSTVDKDFDVTNDNLFELISSGTLFKRAEDKIDYMIVDEAQDFNVSDYENYFIKHANKSITLFGDSSQKIYPHKGATIDELYAKLKLKRFFLNFNYRLPMSVAKVAQDILEPAVDLISANKKDGGNSDYPNYPKPIISKLDSEDAELNAILSRINNEDLDDVAILVPTEEYVKKVYDFLNNNGVNSQVHYRTRKAVPYRTINTLDFSNNDIPCILTYHAAKGTEFDNVFIPFANKGNLPDRNAFYVACTRTSRGLFISYNSAKTQFLDNIKPNTVVENGK